MKQLAKKISAMALCTIFASMQVSFAFDTGLGAGNGGADINNISGGFVNGSLGSGNADLNFDGNSHVDWNTLNVNKGESLNFNAVNGANGITIVNTVRNGMSKIYGNINSNDGVAKLIISNPNGMLFDGAKFTTAGDLMLTTQALGVNFVNGNMNITGLAQEAVNGVTISNSDFTIGGEFNITAPTIDVVKSVIAADKGFKLITADGQNYLVCPTTSNDTQHVAIRLESVSVNGDVYIASGKDLVKIVNGSEVNGNLKVVTDGNVALNYSNNGEKLHVTGDVDVDNDGRISYLRNSNIEGNVKMHNSGGFLEIKDVDVKGNVDLKTTDKTNHSVKHFIHVVGDNTIGGDLNIDSIHNVHIGGYDNGLQALQPGSLTVGGNIDAVAHDGSIAVTVDTSADKVSLTSETLNIITDGKATITANEHSYKAKHYIGGVNAQNKIINIMENYIPLDNVKTGAYMNINGGKVNKIETAKAYIKSKNNMTVDGVNAGEVYLTADQADIKIDKNNHADLITVGGETKNLTVELPSNSRDYTLKYTNIKNTEVTTINPETEITYEMANGNEGWNKGTQTKDNTYLVVPGGSDPDPGPGPGPNPGPDPDPNVPTPDEPEKILNNLNRDQMAAAIDANQVYTPVAFAADLDDEIDTGVRKNVDGSVTVVRPFTPSN